MSSGSDHHEPGVPPLGQYIGGHADADGHAHAAGHADHDDADAGHADGHADGHSVDADGHARADHHQHGGRLGGDRGVVPAVNPDADRRYLLIALGLIATFIVVEIAVALLS